ncbi:MAG: hypothetical protein VX777_05250 [Chlamydiota bacterium]|nr:hypothetical protein [Chlamydiota bacterium]
MKDITGNYYLTPIDAAFTERNYSDTSVTGLYEPPSTAGWPVEAKTKEEYWSLIDRYPGGIVERKSTYIDDLLNDDDLNVPDSKVLIETGSGEMGAISRQVVSDIRRRSKVVINGRTVFDMQAADSLSEALMESWPDEEKAAVTIKECLKAFNGNWALTKNALLLQTQATQAPLTTLVLSRFQYLEPIVNPSCVRDIITIQSHESGITTLYIVSLWCLKDYGDGGPSVERRFMKTAIEIAILTKDLEAKRAGDAITYEKCSKFFKTHAEAEECDLRGASWPSGAKSLDIYNDLLQECFNLPEVIQPLMVKSLFMGESELSNLSVLEVVDFFINSNPLLQKISLNGECVYCADHSDSLIVKRERLQGGYLQIFRSMDKNFDLTHRLLCFSLNGVQNHIDMICASRFSNAKLGKETQCINYEVDFSIDLKGNIVTAFRGLWEISDLSDYERAMPKYLNVFAEIKLSIESLMKDDFDAVKTSVKISDADSGTSRKQWLKA